MGTDVNEGVNGHPVAEFGIGMNEGQRADSGKAALRCGEQLQNAAEVLVGIFADQGASDIPGVFGTDYDGASPRCRELVSVFGVCQKAHFIGPGPLQGVDADDFGIVALARIKPSWAAISESLRATIYFLPVLGSGNLLPPAFHKRLTSARTGLVMSRLGVAYITLPAAASRIRSSFCCLAIVVAAS